jgi:hypothetical protein
MLPGPVGGLIHEFFRSHEVTVFSTPTGLSEAPSATQTADRSAHPPAYARSSCKKDGRPTSSLTSTARCSPTCGTTWSSRERSGPHGHRWSRRPARQRGDGGRRPARAAALSNVTAVQLYSAHDQRTRGAIAFLNWLDAAGLTLSTCRQTDLDRWLADGQAVYREEAGRLVRWARAARLTSCYLPSAARWTGPSSTLDGEDRWDIAQAPARRRAPARRPPRRAAHPPLRPERDGDQPHDRQSGPGRRRRHPPPRASARPAARAGRHPRPRRRGEPQRPRHHRGRRAVTLAAPRRAAQQPAARGPRDRPPPGPQHGTVPARRRDPAAILARTLGISTDVAVTWQRLSVGDWAAYAADVSRRPGPDNGRPPAHEASRKV